MSKPALIPLKTLVSPVSTWNPLKPEHDGDSFEYIDLSAVDQELKSVTGARTIPCADAPSRARQLARANDVLVSTVRPNLNGVAMVPAELDGATASTGFCVIRAKQGVLEPSYVFQWVKSPAFVDKMVTLATGASYPAVSDRIVLDSEIPLPSLAEQRRVAAILDKADALRTKRREALAQLNRLAQSIFEAMFGGGTHAPVNAADAEMQHRQGWRWVLLTDVARLATGHTPDRDRPEYWGGSIPWISLTDIRGLNGSRAHKTGQNVTELGIQNSSAVVLPPGTVCFSRTASVGFVTVMGSPMATSQDFMNWVPGPDIDSTYLMYALMYSRPQLLALSTGSTHRTIYMRVVERFRVLFPPIELQRAFAARIAAIDRSRQTHEASLDALEEAFSALQQRVFQGAL